MMQASQLGGALRYRYKSVATVFLLVTCACWWLFASHAVQRSAPGPVPSVNQPVQQPSAPGLPQSSALSPPAPASGLLTGSAGPDIRPTRPHAPVVTRNDAQIKQLQTMLWSAMDRRNAVESRLAELNMPAAPIVRQPAAIASVSPEVRAAAARVATAHATLTELQTRYTDAYPDVLQAKDELAEAEQALYSARHLASSVPVKARVVAPSPPSAQVEAERTALRAELAELSPTIPDLKAQLDAASALPRHAPTAAPATHDGGYWPLVLPQPTVAEAPPVAPATPTPAIIGLPQPVSSTSLLSAHSLIFLPQSMLLGFFASCILLMVLESLDHTIKGPESLRQALPAEARQISLRSMRA